MSQGKGIAKDTKRAAVLFRRACDGGEMGACAEAGLLLAQDDKGVLLFTEESRALLRRACDGNEPMGCDFLALATAPSEALALRDKACALKYWPSCNAAAEAVLSTDRERALKYYQASCAIGGSEHNDACSKARGLAK
jgi:hypothetical protein